MMVQRCPVCGKRTRADLPSGVPRRPFGPRWTAVVALLTGRYRLSRREVRQLLEDVDSPGVPRRGGAARAGPECRPGARGGGSPDSGPTGAGREYTRDGLAAGEAAGVAVDSGVRRA